MKEVAMEKLNCNLTNYAFNVIKQIKHNSLSCCYEHYSRANSGLVIRGSPFLALTERLENVIICNHTHISLCSCRKRPQANPSLVRPSTLRFIYSSAGSCVQSGKQSHPCHLCLALHWLCFVRHTSLICSSSGSSSAALKCTSVNHWWLQKLMYLLSLKTRKLKMLHICKQTKLSTCNYAFHCVNSNIFLPISFVLQSVSA